MHDINNIEPLCAKYGMKLVESVINNNVKKSDCANVINKALGILVENGFYAMSVFLLSCKVPSNSTYGRNTLSIIMEMLADPDAGILQEKWADNPQKDLENLRKITENLPKLLFARKLVENALTFGRYHCKALP